MNRKERRLRDHSFLPAGGRCTPATVVVSEFESQTENRSASCLNSQFFQPIQPLRIEDHPRSGTNQDTARLPPACQPRFLACAFSPARFSVSIIMAFPIRAFLVSGCFAPAIHFRYSPRCALVQSAKKAARPVFFSAPANSCGRSFILARRPVPGVTATSRNQPCPGNQPPPPSRCRRPTHHGRKAGGKRRPVCSRSSVPSSMRTRSTPET